MPRGISDSRSRLAFVVITGLATIGFAVAMGQVDIDRTPGRDADAPNLHALWWHWISFGTLWVMLSAVWWRLARDDSPEHGIKAATFIILIALSARLIVLFVHEPALSDDIYRYIFDGRNVAHGINPYTVTPADRIADEAVGRWPGERAIAGRINHPELATIYLPTSQWMFAVAGATLPESWTSPEASARWFRAWFIGIELVLMILLAGALLAHQRSTMWLALYAWHPLAISSIAGSGHQDVIGMVLLVMAIALMTMPPARTWLWSVALGAAACVKPMVVPLAAFGLRGCACRRWIVSMLAGFVTASALSAPMLLSDGGRPLLSLLETSREFAAHWAHFGGAYELFAAGFGSYVAARLACLVLLGVVLLIVFLRGRDLWRQSMIALLAMVLLSTTAHPWYLLWALAIFPVAAGRAGDTRPLCGLSLWIFSFTITFGYVAYAHVESWHVPTWVLVIAFAPVYVGILLELFVSGKRE